MSNQVIFGHYFYTLDSQYTSIISSKSLYRGCTFFCRFREKIGQKWLLAGTFGPAKKNTTLVIDILNSKSQIETLPRAGKS